MSQDFETHPIGTKKELEQLRAQLREAEAREAVMVEALADIRNHTILWPKDSIRPVISALNIRAETALANTSEQAKALLAVVEAAREVSEWRYNETPNERRFFEALAKLDKLTGGGT